jgi:hypothetical protein
MPHSAQLRQWVERVVNAVFSDTVPGLRDDIAQRLKENLGKSFPVDPYVAGLRGAMAAIHHASAQSDILRALLDGASRFCTRTALLVVSGDAAVGWQARGFRENDAIKLLNLDIRTGLLEQAMRTRQPAEGSVVQFDARFSASFGAPTQGICCLAPLVVRDRVSAFVYADSGIDSEGQLDFAAVDILTLAAGDWIEILALRKMTASLSGASAIVPSLETVVVPPPSPETTAVPSAAKGLGNAAGGSVPESADATAGAIPLETAAGPVVPNATVATTAPPPSPQLSAAAEEELHRKARRFAKLLVDEIKLYNQAKVAEGKRHCDLYERLKTDIEKSRVTYNKRYAQSVVAGAGYFDLELVRNLAEDNVALLGSKFPH